jgi:Restriction endonuclease
MAPAWKEYQEAAAAHYRALGLFAQTDQVLQGMRGKHAVDIVVRGYRAGVEFLWLVECKWWNRRVPKSVVVTLAGIMQDVGADRGIVLSRRGFQSGASTMANKSNITLTGLDELVADTEDDYIEYQCGVLRKRCEAIIDTLHSSGLEKTRDSKANPLDWPDIVFGARADMLKTAIEEAVSGRWPVTMSRTNDGLVSYAHADNISDFITLTDFTLGEIENELAAAIRELED